MTPDAEVSLLARVTKLEQDRDAHRSMLQSGGDPASVQLDAIRAVRELLAALDKRVDAVERYLTDASTITQPQPSASAIDVTWDEPNVGVTNDRA
jgi:hypothetical protein